MLSETSGKTRPTFNVATIVVIAPSLPQAPVAPEGLSVETSWPAGRYPHQSFLRQWSRDDQAQVEWALQATATASSPRSSTTP